MNAEQIEVLVGILRLCRDSLRLAPDRPEVVQARKLLEGEIANLQAGYTSNQTRLRQVLLSVKNLLEFMPITGNSSDELPSLLDQQLALM
jgi:hypothetical protein